MARCRRGFGIKVDSVLAIKLFHKHSYSERRDLAPPDTTEMATQVPDDVYDPFCLALKSLWPTISNKGNLIVPSIANSILDDSHRLSRKNILKNNC